MTAKQKKNFFRKVKEKFKKGTFISFAVYFFFVSIFSFTPLNSFALTGGPSQPEVQSFEPVGTSDMVNVFSGDMTYNIPLLDVDGYPINLAYNAGVTTDQEASWTGLGWNINVGTINRALRGLPDDFNGDKVITETNIRKDWTVGVSADVSDLEVFGLKFLKLGFGFGMNYNNYNGVGTDLSFNVGASFPLSDNLGLNAGLGLSSSSAGGLNISPSAGLSGKVNKSGTKLGGTIGSSFNSRGGLSSLSIGVNITDQRSASVDKKNKSKKGQKNYGKSKDREAFSAGGASTSFDMQQPTYTPSISNSMRSFAVTGRFKVISAEVVGNNFGLSLTANYSEQKLKDKIIAASSYGYLYSDAGQNNKNARHDYNRENSGSVTPATPNLALTNYTYDIYSVSGQGVGGSYRPYRNQIGYVYNNDASNKSNSFPFTLEFGTGMLFHGGIELGVVKVNSQSGMWSGQNQASGALSFKNKDNAVDYENVVFREANEMSVATDPAFYQTFGGSRAVRLNLYEHSKFNVDVQNHLIGNGGFSQAISRNYTKGRVKRSATIQNLTIDKVNKGYGITSFIPGSKATSAPLHHIGQIISLGSDGLRYVYGQPAYNKEQKEVTFAVGSSFNNSNINGTVEYEKGLISYSGTANSTDNTNGVDNYYQSVSTPAYAHSYLLTAVVSDDYVDADNIPGPSDNDLGTYTKFNYEKIDNYKWRTPCQENKASYNEGLKSDPTDDKASYIYGVKELFYLDKIETKNFIAIFHKENREDGLGVKGENGGKEGAVRQRLLKKISLYTKLDYATNGANATPIKEVHFEYDYSLCQGITNSINNGGKLTLKKVYFTYRDSKKGKLTPYVFEYQNNYGYNLKSYDRWGNYKRMPSLPQIPSVTDSLPTYEFPYLEQNKTAANDEQAKADQNAAAWSLSTIHLPSGGQIDIDYEADDYGYVQNKKAMEMVKIVAVGNNTNDDASPLGLGGGIQKVPVSNNIKQNRKIYFEIDPTRSVNEYVNGIDDLYYRCLSDFKNDRFDYVSGYSKITQSGEANGGSTGKLGWILLEPVDFGDAPTGDINPITMAAIQFARLHLPKIAWDSPSLPDNSTFGISLVQSFFTTFVTNFSEGFKNPNKTIYDKGRGQDIVLEKSWIRLNNVNSKKLGGGHRVKAINITDNWTEQTNTAMNNATYGQEYEYTNKDGSSSGVASYEPQLGGDENPWKQPVTFNNDKKWAPDDRFYQETPFGESFFPSASVGYGRVVVKNKQYSNVKKNATGFVEHTFYTAKDFPTNVSKTALDHKRHKSSPFSLASLFKIKTKDYYTGSQGFVVETNDMHGKPKTQSVYAENEQQPISKIEYKYKATQGSTASTKRLVNNATFIKSDGTITQGLMGENFDMVADFQHTKTSVLHVAVNPNIDAFSLGIIPVVLIPMSWFTLNQDETQFRSAVLTKVVQKFGILESTTATDLGSKVVTKNLAYDAETGQVLLTETTTNFDDKVYSMNYPAYWHYESMGLAYKNIGFTTNGMIASAGNLNTPHASYFVPGDEVALTLGLTYEKAWVISTTNNTVQLQLKDGSPPINGNYIIEVLRSGRRNLQSQMMASLISLKNPLHNIQNNIYEEVLQASAIEYTDEWRTYCDCNDDNVMIASTNPYVIGTKGNYKPKKSHLHLSSRVQSDYNNNTDIRKDGVFESYRPFYRVNSSGEWQIDQKDWTYTSEITEFNPYGQELENQDALGRYSAATFGFNQTLPKSVAANSRYRETGFTSFEDIDFSDCSDNHFKFEQLGDGVIDTDAHAGRKSIKVSPSNEASLKRDLAWCDPEGCMLGFTIEITSGAGDASLLIVEVDNPSSIQYAANFDVISGNPSIIPTANGFNIVSNGIPFQVEFNAIGEDGCQITKTLAYGGGNINSLTFE